MAVLIGIPWLATVLGSLFTGLVGFLANFVTRRLAIIAAVVTALLAVSATFVAAMEGLISSIATGFPAAGYAWNLFVPDNFSVVISVVVSAKLLSWVYHWNLKLAQTKLI